MYESEVVGEGGDFAGDGGDCYGADREAETEERGGSEVFVGGEMALEGWDVNCGNDGVYIC